MFNFFKKKETLNSEQRFEILHSTLKDDYSKVGNDIVKDMSMYGSETPNTEYLIGLVMAEMFGFGILALNLAIKDDRKGRMAALTTMGDWDKAIKAQSIFLKVIPPQEQLEVSARILTIQQEFGYLYSSSSFGLAKEQWNHMQKAFQNEARWILNKSKTTAHPKVEQWIALMLSTAFSKFNKKFSKYNHE